MMLMLLIIGAVITGGLAGFFFGFVVGMEHNGSPIERELAARGGLRVSGFFAFACVVLLGIIASL